MLKSGVVILSIIRNRIDQSYKIITRVMQKISNNQTNSFWRYVIQRDDVYYEGVPRINIYFLRVLFLLMFLFLTYETWGVILNHKGAWDGTKAAAWCMWASYSLISFIGVIKPLKMLPIVLFEIIYKVTWLIIVAYPLWVKGELKGSSIESMANVYVWVVFPIIAMPWKYFIHQYVWLKK